MEKLLHYVWKHKILPLTALTTTGGEPLEVLDAGLHNYHAGPDFFNAKVRVGGTVWAGNVELHLRSSDWFRHNHHTDPAYDNVVLHVAQDVDCDVVTSQGKRPPQLRLDIPDRLRTDYEELLRVEDYPRCHRIVASVPALTAHAWMDTLLSERMDERANDVARRLSLSHGDWERALFVTLARGFGFGLNGDAFEAWARLVPLDKTGKHRDELRQIEAIFLGLANLLHRAKDEALAREYAYQQRLFDLPQPMDAAAWKYMRLRPCNFPHVRLLQLARIYHRGTVGMAALLDAARGGTLHKLLRDMPAATRRLIITNTAVPVLYAYAREHADDELQQRLADVLRDMPAEDNRIMRQWNDCGLRVSSMADSQALMQLKRKYCDRLDCLRCRFGYEYFKHSAP